MQPGHFWASTTQSGLQHFLALASRAVANFEQVCALLDGDRDLARLMLPMSKPGYLTTASGARDYRSPRLQAAWQIAPVAESPVRASYAS